MFKRRPTMDLGVKFELKKINGCDTQKELEEIKQQSIDAFHQFVDSLTEERMNNIEKIIKEKQQMFADFDANSPDFPDAKIRYYVKWLHDALIDIKTNADFKNWYKNTGEEVFMHFCEVFVDDKNILTKTNSYELNSSDSFICFVGEYAPAKYDFKDMIKMIFEQSGNILQNDIIDWKQVSILLNRIQDVTLIML